MPDVGNEYRSGEYVIEKLAEGVYAIDSDRDESMYLVCGSERAVMIDTGSCRTPVMPVIRELWDGSVELVLTHAHYDHMEHCAEFDKVSVHEDDIAAWKKSLRMLVHLGEISSGSLPKRFPVYSFHPLRGGDRIPLGGKELEVLNARGHTPGSVMFIDRADKLVFAGDAIGSGQYVWMWLAGCSTVSEYRESLRGMLETLEPMADFRFLGGHRRQGKPFSDEETAHVLSLQTARDLETLCGRILSGEEKPVGYERQFGLIRTPLYCCGLGAFYTTRRKIR